MKKVLTLFVALLIAFSAAAAPFYVEGTFPNEAIANKLASRPISLGGQFKGDFTVSYDLKITSPTADSIIGLMASESAWAFGNIQAMLSWDSDGSLSSTFQAYNGKKIASTLTAAAAKYFVETRITGSTYTIYITPEGGSRTLITSAEGYAFRNSTYSYTDTLYAVSNGGGAGAGSYEVSNIAIDWHEGFIPLAIDTKIGETVVKTETEKCFGGSYECDTLSRALIEYNNKYYCLDLPQSTIALNVTEGADNRVTLVYKDADIESVDEIIVTTPHHIAPDMPRGVTVTLSDKSRVQLGAEWSAVSPSDYAAIGSFEAEGLLCSAYPVRATVEVIENNDYIDGWVSTNDFTAHDLGANISGAVVSEFDILPLADYIDGYIGYTDKGRTVSDWSTCAIALRMYTDGRFQYRDGANGYVFSNFYYEKGVGYHIKVIADTAARTYSAYATRKGAGYDAVICENASFRSGASLSAIGSMVVRGGAGVAAGEFIVGNHTLRSAREIEYIGAEADDGGNTKSRFAATVAGDAKLIFAAESNGALCDVITKDIHYQKGVSFFGAAALKKDTDYKLFLWKSFESMTPIGTVRTVGAAAETSFLTSFMGSFAYYGNDFDSSLSITDAAIIQSLKVSVYEDAIILKTVNFGTQNGGVQEPSEYILPRKNASGGNALLATFACLSDIHVVDTALTEAENPVREALVRACDYYSAQNIDAVFIGGDVTSRKYVSEERVKEVLDKNYAQLSRISDKVLFVTGNHDYNAGERDGYNSANYYEWYMKDKGLDDLYFEGDYLMGYHTNICGIDIIGINTSPLDLAGSLQDSNYNYTKGTLDYLEGETAKIGADKTTIVLGHFPPNDSNNMRYGTKGLNKTATARLRSIFKNYPNLCYFYGHDHGGDNAFIRTSTAERVTRYDVNGLKMPY